MNLIEVFEYEMHINQTRKLGRVKRKLFNAHPNILSPLIYTIHTFFHSAIFYLFKFWPYNLLFLLSTAFDSRISLKLFVLFTSFLFKKLFNDTLIRI